MMAYGVTYPEVYCPYIAPLSGAHWATNRSMYRQRACAA